MRSRRRSQHNLQLTKITIKQNYLVSVNFQNFKQLRRRISLLKYKFSFYISERKGVTYNIVIQRQTANKVTDCGVVARSRLASYSGDPAFNSWLGDRLLCSSCCNSIVQAISGTFERAFKYGCHSSSEIFFKFVIHWTFYGSTLYKCSHSRQLITSCNNVQVKNPALFQP